MSARRPYARDGRVFHHTLAVKTLRLADGRIELRSPGVGLWRGGPAPGTLLMPGAQVGQLEALGVLHDLVLDDQAHGLSIGDAAVSRLARVPVEHGSLLLTLDPSTGAVLAVEAEAEAGSGAGGLVFSAPSSGRFYVRPSPDKPAFVESGSVVDEGQTLCLLEIMKTFHRISYGGPGLPKRAKIVAVGPADGADVEVGDTLFELEEAGAPLR